MGFGGLGVVLILPMWDKLLAILGLGGTPYGVINKIFLKFFGCASVGSFSEGPKIFHFLSVLSESNSPLNFFGQKCFTFAAQRAQIFYGAIIH